MRVLHVIESFGGGCVTALLTYVRNTHEVEHHIAFRPRLGEFVIEGEFGLFASVHELSPGSLRPMLDIRRIVNSLHPHIIHAHSSFAGAYTRLGNRALADRPIIYTPHCYAFERLDLSIVKRRAFRAVEYLLSWNTTALAACSERELHIGAKFRYPQRTHVPNVAPSVYTPRTVGPLRARSASPIVTGVGRLSPQKSPHFFVEVVQTIRRATPDILAQWIGGGTAEQVRELERHNIRVTGWLSPAQTAQELGQADVYVHTAAWEGFPLAILEADALGLPLACRDIPALHGAPLRWLGTDPEDVAAAVVGVLDDREARLDNRRDWARYLQANTTEVQRARLLPLYFQAMADSRVETSVY